MYKSIAISAIVLMSASSASACGFFTKLAYAGHCSEAEWVEDKKDRALQSGESLVVDNNNIWVVTGDTVTRIEKIDLRGKNKTQAIDFIKSEVGQNIATNELSASLNSGEINQQEFDRLVEEVANGNIEAIADSIENFHAIQDDIVEAGADVSYNEHLAIQAEQAAAADAAANDQCSNGNWCDEDGNVVE